MIKSICEFIMRKEISKAKERELSHLRTCYDMSEQREQLSFEEWLNLVMKTHD